MKRKTIRNHLDFMAAPTDVVVYGKLFMVKIKKSSGEGRYGLIVSKKMFHTAVKRNRVKRLLRDWIAYKEELMEPDLDYVFIASPGVIDAERWDGRGEIINILRKISKLKQCGRFEQDYNPEDFAEFEEKIC